MDRKQRFERVTRDLKVTRVFSTLVEEMKAIGGIAANGGGGGDAQQCTDVMAPVAHSERSPVLLLMGGGMGAGKSTVLKEIREEALWATAGANAVVVEADAFKETDVIYRAISSMGHHNDMLQTAELVRAPIPLPYASLHYYYCSIVLVSTAAHLCRPGLLHCCMNNGTVRSAVYFTFSVGTGSCS